MTFDLSLFLALSGWIFGVISLYIAFVEHFKKNYAEQMLDKLKKAGFSDTLKRTIALIFPQMPELNFDSAIEVISQKYLVTYLRATSMEDPTALIDAWEQIGVQLGAMIQKQTQQHQQRVPDGLAQCISFMFLSHYSKNRGQEYFKNLSRQNEELSEKIARCYLALSKNPSTFPQLVDEYDKCSSNEVQGVIAMLTGEDYKRIAQLFASDKWSRRMMERLREFVRTRQMSYNSLASKVLQTNPLPKLFLIFKNEGSEPESEEEETGKHRPVKAALVGLRNKGNADLIAPMTSVYFIRDESALIELMTMLPEGEENNYLVFASAVDPLSVQIKTSDRLDGQPAQLYERLVKFRDYKEFYESILFRLGIKPSEIIETADLSFLADLKDVQLSDNLRRHSKLIIDKLGEYRGKRVLVLTDLREFDEDDIGFFGSLLAENCLLSQSAGRDLAERIVDESRELHSAMYETNPSR
jgi:hypothetical protein